MIEIIRQLASSDHVLFTLHARKEMDVEGIATDDIINAIRSSASEIIEDYPLDPRGHSHLVLAWLSKQQPAHICCAVYDEALVLITVYLPDAKRWRSDWRSRK